jgi:SIR2-like domain
MASSPINTLSSAQIAKELADAVDTDNCIAWVGSGLSLVRYPGWRELLSQLCAVCGVSDFDPSLGEPSADQLIDKAQDCKATNDGAYKTALSDTFGANKIDTRKAYYLLFPAPFKAYVTTNSDSLLSDAAETFGYIDVFRYPLLEPKQIELFKKPIFYIHGHARPNGAPNGENLVLARSDFNAAYDKGGTGLVTAFLQSVLLSYPIVFLGYSLSDPAVQNLLQRVHSLHVYIMTWVPGFTPKPRFAVLPTIYSEGPPRKRDHDAELIESKRLDELNIKILRYEPSDPKQHWEIEEILKALKDRVRPAKVGLGGATLT